VIGLGSMGIGMARALRRAGFDVVGCNANPATVEHFVREGGRGAPDPASAAANVDIVICVVVNAAQTEAVLFGENGVASMHAGRHSLHLVRDNGPGCLPAACGAARVRRAPYLDAPISSGAFAKARPVLDAMAAKVHDLGAEVGLGSAFKMINQLLAGMHIAAAGEAIAFAAKQGLDLRNMAIPKKKQGRRRDAFRQFRASGSSAADAEQILISLRALPSFEAFRRRRSFRRLGYAQRAQGRCRSSRHPRRHGHGSSRARHRSFARRRRSPDQAR
jgi:3-hydroxyisobutyrate dehydrogenase-like beta-hydroxyacid dehydrogenase